METSGSRRLYLNKSYFVLSDFTLTKRRHNELSQNITLRNKWSHPSNQNGTKQNEQNSTYPIAIAFPRVGPKPPDVTSPMSSDPSAENISVCALAGAFIPMMLILFLVTACHIMSWDVMSWNIIGREVMKRILVWCCVMVSYVMSWDMMECDGMKWDVTWCYVMWCHVISCHVMLSNAIELRWMYVIYRRSHLFCFVLFCSILFCSVIHSIIHSSCNGMQGSKL